MAEGSRPKLLAEGLGHIFVKIFRCNGQSVLMTISFLQFLYFRYKKKFHCFVKYVDYLEIEDFTGKDVVLLKLCRQISSIFQLFETFGFGFSLRQKAKAFFAPSASASAEGKKATFVRPLSPVRHHATDFYIQAEAQPSAVCYH